MTIFYIDESHDAKFYCLCGLYISDTKYNKLEIQTNKFLKDEFKLSEKDELHANDIWNGRTEPWKSMTNDERANVVKKIGDFLSVNLKGPKFILGYETADKKNDHDKYFVVFEKIFPYAVKAVKLNGPSNKQLLVIFDQRDDFKEKDINKQIANLKKVIKKQKGTCAVIDYGYEGISKFSRMLQIADFGVFFYKQYLHYANANIDDNRKKDMLKTLFEETLKGKVVFAK